MQVSRWTQHFYVCLTLQLFFLFFLILRAHFGRNSPVFKSVHKHNPCFLVSRHCAWTLASHCWQAWSYTASLKVLQHIWRKAVRLGVHTRVFDHITPILQTLHWHRKNRFFLILLKPYNTNPSWLFLITFLSSWHHTPLQGFHVASQWECPGTSSH